MIQVITSDNDSVTSIGHSMPGTILFFTETGDWLVPKRSLPIVII